ncbi:MAG: sensor histidine kinase, partial [Flavobacteriaceae bacterium]|nr:sensor histidine kinase [Flavobacteriaceae bacterium]
MNTRKYNWVLYLITATIIITIAVQLYWNYKNYEQNKQQIYNEIQLGLDNAIEEYYANISKKNFLTIVEPNASNDS